MTMRSYGCSHVMGAGGNCPKLGDSLGHLFLRLPRDWPPLERESVIIWNDTILFSLRRRKKRRPHNIVRKLDSKGGDGSSGARREGLRWTHMLCSSPGAAHPPNPSAACSFQLPPLPGDSARAQIVLVPGTDGRVPWVSWTLLLGHHFAIKQTQHVCGLLASPLLGEAPYPQAVGSVVWPLKGPGSDSKA